MTESEKILSGLNEADRKQVEKLLAIQRKEWAKEMQPQPNDFGLRNLPREDPNNLSSPFLKKFKTDKHTYAIIGENGVGFERYTVFQKRSLLRGFGTSFQGIYDSLQQVKMKIAGEGNVATLRSDSILAITGIQDGVAAFTSEQFDAALWLCTLFILREDETVSEYSEAVAEEKMKDWAGYGFSELDFFLLSGSVVAGYGKVYQETMARSPQAKDRFMDAMLTLGNQKAKVGQ